MAAFFLRGYDQMPDLALDALTIFNIHAVKLSNFMLVILCWPFLLAIFCWPGGFQLGYDRLATIKIFRTFT